MIKQFHFLIKQQSICSSGGGDWEAPSSAKQSWLFLQWVTDWKVKADKNRKDHQELQKPILTKLVVIYLHIHLKAGNQFYWVSQHRIGLKKIISQIFWCQRISLKQPRKAFSYLYIQDSSFYTAVLGTSVCFLLPPDWTGCRGLNKTTCIFLQDFNTFISSFMFFIFLITDLHSCLLNTVTQSISFYLLICVSVPVSYFHMVSFMFCPASLRGRPLT